MIIELSDGVLAAKGKANVCSCRQQQSGKEFDTGVFPLIRLYRHMTPRVLFCSSCFRLIWVRAREGYRRLTYSWNNFQTRRGEAIKVNIRKTTNFVPNVNKRSCRVQLYSIELGNTFKMINSENSHF